MRNLVKMFVLVGLLGGGADAAVTPLRSLLESGSGNLGSVRIDGDFFVVHRRTAPNQSLLLGVSSMGAVGGKVSGVGVFARKEYLTPAEQKVFGQAVLNVALKCFNLRPERQAAISAWLERQNASTFRDVDADFGPMNLRFVRELDDQGDYWTWVRMERAGTPGISPWINFCRP